jgi:hypothetical protein
MSPACNTNGISELINPSKWSDLKYVFKIDKEDRDAEKEAQAGRDHRQGRLTCGFAGMERRLTLCKSILI